jgi:pentatricopeptide repeat protein
MEHHNGRVSMHGHGDKALDFFAQMKQQGFCPDDVRITLLPILSYSIKMCECQSGYI